MSFLGYAEDGLIVGEDALKVAEFFGVPWAGTAEEWVEVAASVIPDVNTAVTSFRQVVTDIGTRLKGGGPTTSDDAVSIQNSLNAALERHREVVAGEARP